MEKLILRSRSLLNIVNTDYIRNPGNQIKWDWRLTGILGARGAGKTTLFLQQLKTRFDSSKSVYITLDDIYFTENSLIDFIESFRSQGGQYFFIDEVHKYPGWARELKNAYDYFPDIYLFFTGSSAIEISRQEVDLSRRAMMYELPGLSFREYLKLKEGLDYPILNLKEVLSRHTEIAADISAQLKPLLHFRKYLESGYYPFFLEDEAYYLPRLEKTVRLTIDVDLNFIEGYDPRNARKIYQLLYILATNVPFKPNIKKLSEKIGISRQTLIQYLHYLEKTRLIGSLIQTGKSISILQKPDKIYLNNTNLAYALSPSYVNEGTLRETFFLNQLSTAHTLSLPSAGDFLIDETFTFEIGGKRKTNEQIRHLPDAYVAADEIEIGFQQKIPLWLFGFLY
ncbi:MAG: ATP-binding protein [Cyclobacteriaceae bacterium]